MNDFGEKGHKKNIRIKVEEWLWLAKDVRGKWVREKKSEHLKCKLIYQI